VRRTVRPWISKSTARVMVPVYAFNRLSTHRFCWGRLELVLGIHRQHGANA
jgi:hypothetical protein